MSYFIPNSVSHVRRPETQHVKTFLSLALMAGLIGWVLGIASGPVSAGPFMEQNTDRRGGDYKTVTLSQDNPAACAAVCSDEGQCLAWTYVRAGIEGSTPACRLKLTVPEGKTSPCCVSGVRVGSGLAPQARR